MPCLKVTITDTLSFWDDFLESHTFNPNNSSTIAGWYQVPDGWLSAEGDLPEEKREVLFKYLYGPTWRSGNEDGSKYVVLKCDVHRLTDAEAQLRPWATGKESCYVVGADNTVTKVEREKM